MVERASRARTFQLELDEMGVGRPVEDMPKTHRGASNGNSNGNSEDRRRRRQWLVDTFTADVFLVHDEFSNPREVPASALDVYGDDAILCCRCYRCGKLCTVDTVTVDRIVPGCQGGTYRRNNIRPACSKCNSETGGATRSKPAPRACPSCGGRTKYRRLISVSPLDARRCTDDRHPK
jgi:hypothetical protein